MATASLITSPSSELHANAAVDDAAVERRPRVHGPASVNRPGRTKDGIPPRLPDIGQVLAVEKQQKPADAAAHEQPEHVIRHALSAKRVVVEPLSARVVPLGADTPGPRPLPRGVQPDAVPRRQRHLHPALLAVFTR